MDGHYCPPPRTDPYVRLSRIRFLPRVRTASRCRRAADDPAPVTRRSGAVSGTCVAELSSPRPPPFAPQTPPRSPGFVRLLHRYYGEVRLLTPVHHALRLLAFRMRTRTARGRWSDVRPPRFRRDPFVREVALDLGRASAPRITAPHMSPSTDNNGSAPATFSISRLNPTPHTIAVYASPLPSPTAAQHSLAGGRYPLPAPDSHRLDRASFAWRTLCSCSAQNRHIWPTI
jgi:hypothetical protein